MNADTRRTVVDRDPMIAISMGKEAKLTMELQVTRAAIAAIPTIPGPLPACEVAFSIDAARGNTTGAGSARNEPTTAMIGIARKPRSLFKSLDRDPPGENPITRPMANQMIATSGTICFAICHAAESALTVLFLSFINDRTRRIPAIALTMIYAIEYQRPFHLTHSYLNGIGHRSPQCL